MYVCGYFLLRIRICCGTVMNMKLYLKRDVSARDVGFVIVDELGHEKYRAVSVSTKVTKRTNLLLLDANGQPAAKIRRLPIVGTYTFVMRVKKSHITFVMVPVKGEILSYFYGNNWHVNGNIAAKNFTVIDVDKTVILHHRKHADHCTLEYFDRDNELYCVTAAICANLINTVEKPVIKAVNI